MRMGTQSKVSKTNLLGKTVIAFTWVDSYFDPDFFDSFLLAGNKIGLLEGATS